MPSPVRICLGLSILTVVLSSSNVNSQPSNAAVVSRELNPSESTSNQNISTPKPQRNFRSTNIWRRNKPNKADSKGELTDSNELMLSQANDDSSPKSNVSNNIKIKRGQIKFSDHKVEESKKSVVISRTRKREELPQDRLDSTTKSDKRNIERTTTSQIPSSKRTYKKNIPKLNFVRTTPRTTTKVYETTISKDEEDEDEEDDTLDIEKYTSPEFHDVNNTYRLSTSHTSYFEDDDYGDNSDEMETDEARTTVPPYNSYPKSKEVKHAFQLRSTTPSPFSTLDFDLTTPYVHSFDSILTQMTDDIMQTLNANKSSSTRYPKTSQEVKKEMNYEHEIFSDEPNNPSKIYYKNTKKVTVSDSEKEAGPGKKLSDVYGTSIYFESSMVSTETYNLNSAEEADCDNTTTTEVSITPVPDKVLQISLIDSNVVTNDAHSMNKTDDLSSNELVTSTVRRMQFTTPKTRRRISMKTKRIDPETTRTPVATNSSTGGGKFSLKEILRRKPIFTTISPEIDPIYQSDSTPDESDQNIGISTLSKRGSMKYSTNDTSSQKLESTLMAIPPTSPAWVLMNNMYPPTKNRTTTAGTTIVPVAGVEVATTDSTVRESQAVKDKGTDIPTSHKYMAFSEMFGTSTQTAKLPAMTVTPTEAVHSETTAPVYVPANDTPWLPIAGGYTDANSQLVFDITSSTQTPTDTTHLQHSTTPTYPTESASTENQVIEEYTEISITVSDVRSSTNLFESITKLPMNTTTPISEENDKSTIETSITTEQSEDVKKSSTTEKYTTKETITITPDNVTNESLVTEVSIDIEQTTEENTRNSSNEDQFTATSNSHNTPYLIANAESEVPSIYTTTPSSREEETTTKRNVSLPEVIDVVPTTMETLSIDESTEVPITTYRPKHYITTNQQEDYTTQPTNSPSLFNTDVVDVASLTTNEPKTTTSDDYIFDGAHSTTSTLRLPTLKPPRRDINIDERTTEGSTDSQGIFTTQKVTGNAMEATVSSSTSAAVTETADSSEDSMNESNIDESEEPDFTTESEEVPDEDLPVDDISTHSADITQYVDGRNSTPHNTEVITGRPATEDPNYGEVSGEAGAGVTVAVWVSVIGLVSLALLVALLVVVRRRSSRGGALRRCRPITPLTLDSCRVGGLSIGKGRSLEKRSYGNPAYENEVVVSHSMGVSALASFAADAQSVWGEFGELQAGCGAGLGVVPQGCEDKNRYANVLPPAETRVPLTRLRDDPTTEYINANYVTGPGNIRNYYIACQAPMANTVVDFWRMIWEQNSRLVLMLTEYMENGVEKCYEYLPPSEVSDNKRTFGDFQVILKKREHHEKYAVSTLQLRHVPSGVWRELRHMWYFWPAKGVPEDYESVIDFLSESRGHMKAAQLGRDYDEGCADDSSTDGDADGEVHTYSPLHEQERVTRARARVDAGNATLAYSPRQAGVRGGTNGSVAAGNVAGGKQSVTAVSAVRPCVVHCSAGAGRTGAVLAVDACTRALEASGTCDVPRVVRHLCAQRPQAVQNKHQYMFIYKVLSEYGNKLSGAGFDNV